MKVYDKPIVVKKKADGTFIISIAITDNNVLVKALARKDAELLARELNRLLGGPETAS